MSQQINPISGSLGKKYLKDYSERTGPILERILAEKEKAARANGKLPGDIVAKFTEIALRGKRIRGSLVTLGYQIFGGKVNQIFLKTSLFAELAQTAILIQDDIMDKADTRRGVESHHVHFRRIGKKLNTPDADNFAISMTMNGFMEGHYYAWDLLLGSGLPTERVFQAGKVFSHYIQRLCDGQTLDVVGLDGGKFDKSQILKVLRLKTAEYTGEMPLELGAILAGAKKGKRLTALKQFGIEFGWAFQIQDDILGMFGDAHEVGKPVDSDLAEGKKTLLMLHLHHHGTAKERAFMRKVLGNPKVTKSEITRMKKILLDRGSYDYVVAEGWKHVENGKRLIPEITSDPKLAGLLESLIVYMMERTL